MADNRTDPEAKRSRHPDPLTEILRGARPVRSAAQAAAKPAQSAAPPMQLPQSHLSTPIGPSLTEAEIEQNQETRQAMRLQAAGRARPNPPTGKPGAPPEQPSISPSERAFAAWKNLSRVAMAPTAGRRRAPPLVNLFREDPAARAFDLLRTRLMQTLRSRRWNRVAISAPTAGAGTTFTAVNLALSLARIRNSRTVLMDLNQRDPGVADMLGVSSRADLQGFINGKVPISHYLLRVSKTLALGLTSERNVGASELLHDPDIGPRLDRMRALLRPDVVLYDLPPVLAHDDLLAFLPNVDGVLLVSDGTETTAKQLVEAERVLKGHSRLLGVILNRARPAHADG